MLQKFWEYVGKSLPTKIDGKISTTRIQSYLILGSILTATAVFLIIDVINAIEKWCLNEMYTVPTEHITIFGMVLAHHLALLGINKNSENKTAQSAAQKPVEPAKSEPAKKTTEKPKENTNNDEPAIQKDDSLNEEGK